ncbi:MAG: hypothetical protein LBU32_07965 [Clostridiales bacterium]|jgi:vacuolar-type H+-ATPase subunit E/Vma4|nr:hypothetical protein [Clostridiales bacterium]
MKIKEKLAFFSKMAAQEAEQQRKAILTDIEGQMNEAVAEITMEAEKQAAKRIQSESFKIAQMKNKEVIRAATQAKRSVVDLRASLIDDLFNNALARVKAYTLTPEYRERISEEIKELALKRQNFKVLLMERDADFHSDFSSCSDFEAVKEDFIGGFKLLLEDRNALEDHTYLTRLIEARAEFNELKFGETQGGASDVGEAK